MAGRRNTGRLKLEGPIVSRAMAAEAMPASFEASFRGLGLAADRPTDGGY